MTEGNGGPLAMVVAGANVPDAKLLDQTLEAIVVKRPKPSKAKPQHLCLDKGYDNPTGEAAVAKHRYTPHIRRIGEEKLRANLDGTIKKVCASPLGRGKDISMVIQVPWLFDTLREEGEQLPSAPSTCLCVALVPQAGSSRLLR